MKSFHPIIFAVLFLTASLTTAHGQIPDFGSGGMPDIRTICAMIEKNGGALPPGAPAGAQMPDCSAYNTGATTSPATGAKTKKTYQATASACPAITKTLTRGMKGKEVTALQTFLSRTQTTVKVSVTGTFDRPTETALKALQKRAGLAETGTTGPKTRSLIKQICAKLK